MQSAFEGSDVKKAKDVMHNIGMQIVQEKKSIVAKLGIGASINPSRDLLTLLTKANMDPSIPENQRLSDEDILARKSAFYHRYGLVLIVGHCTCRGTNVSITRLANTFLNKRLTYVTVASSSLATKQRATQQPGHSMRLVRT